MASLSQWVAGARPRTLPAAVAPVVLGTAAAHLLGRADAALGILALVVLEPGAVRAGLTAYELRAHLRGILPDHALPRRAVTAGAVPTRGPGKPDRRAVAAMFTMG